jgi:hypothetical protein
VLASVALDGGGDDASSLFLRTGLGIFQNVTAQMGRIAGRLLFHLLEEQRPGFEGTQSRQRLELTLSFLGQATNFQPVLFGLVPIQLQRIGTATKFLLVLSQALHLSTHRSLPFGQSGLGGRQTRSFGFEIPVLIRAPSIEVLLCRKTHFNSESLGFLAGLISPFALTHHQFGPQSPLT